jgi:hypothetical protein
MSYTKTPAGAKRGPLDCNNQRAHEELAKLHWRYLEEPHYFSELPKS